MRVGLLARLHALIDFLAVWADGELLWVAAWNPLFATERAHWLATERRFHDLVLLHVVRKTLVVAVVVAVLIQQLFKLTVEHGG